ncbi:MAG: HlyD family secretion protein [Asticcacaulis sp. 32-58-5]|nr:MAG: HlyD family secretion protein [Asticcacaulis sp. 32-58-5]
MINTLSSRRTLLTAVAALSLATLAACGDKKAAPKGGEAKEAAADDYERGPHRGRMLRDGDFAVEITIFEDGVEPEYRVYPFFKDKPVVPGQVQLAIELTRLGNVKNNIGFAPQDDFLRGNAVIIEPHSFDVKVQAAYQGKTHNWAFASYEGRTTIDADAAKAGGIKTEMAGPASIGETVTMAGRVEIKPEGKSQVRAWYPGRILMLNVELGQTVRKGQVLARVESSESLQTYSITAPLSGVVIEKNANVGDTTEGALLVIADPTKLHGEFFVYPRDAERVKVGQTVEVRSLSGEAKVLAKVEAILPTADLVSQTLVAHVHIPETQAAGFRPGMGIEGDFAVNAADVPLAVRSKGLQPFRDFTVVYAKVGNTYEVRMLDLGRKSPEWTEVLGGLEPGTEYVTDGAFLIRADIDKSGASHDH